MTSSSSQVARTVGRALRNRHWLIWSTMLMAVILAVVVAAQRPPSYTATAVLVLDEQQEAGLGFDLALQADQYLTQRFVAMATSRPVLEEACRQAGGGCDATWLARNVTAAATKTAGVINVTAKGPTGPRAALYANAVASQVVAQARAQVIATLTPTRDYLRGELDQLAKQRDALQQKISQWPRNGLSDAAVANQTAPLLAQLNLLQTQYSTTYQRMQDVDVQQAKRSNALLVRQTAQVPSTPSDPDLVRYVLVAEGLGLVFGVLLSLVVDRFDNRLRDPADLAVAAGAGLVLDTSVDDDAFALLVQAGVVGALDTARSLLVVGSSPGDAVHDVGLAVANGASEIGRRVRLVTTEPVAEPAAEAEEEAAEVDLVVTCAKAPTLDPKSLLLVKGADAAVLVATRARTEFDDARRTAELLRLAGVRLQAAVLLPRPPRSLLARRPNLRLKSAPALSSQG